jgi:hypothetical protein
VPRLKHLYPLPNHLFKLEKLIRSQTTQEEKN